MKKLLFFLFLLAIVSSSCKQESRRQEVLGPLSSGIASNDVHVHIKFLASDSLEGRFTGSAGEAMAAVYIADRFKQFGLRPMGDDGTYYQQFEVNMNILNNPHQMGLSDTLGERRLSRNVIAMIPGTSQQDDYIVIGAHYDHLGRGEYGSLINRRRNQIHNGADDNASGTAGVLELAQYFSNNPPRKSLVFITFSGEEIGLLGSRYFVEHPTVPLDRIQAMINLDMVGRLRDNRLIIYGLGTSPEWENIIQQANIDSIDIKTVPDGTGASDHTSFYNKQIPVLHYFTDTHPDYHRPTDDTEFINFEGEQEILDHVSRVIEQLDERSAGQLVFTETPTTQQNIQITGVTLGVTPDYGFEGPGLRITGTRAGGPAQKAGLKSGDVIITLDGETVKDIYGYMEILNTLEEGDESTVTVRRDDDEFTFDIQF